MKVENASKETLISVKNISKHFGGIKALKNVSFSLRKGEIMAIAGHNGAGKSVLIKIMGGFYPPDNGTILYDGHEVRLKSPKDSQDRGYYVVPQELTVAGLLSVADNIFVGRKEHAYNSGFLKKSFIHRESKRLLKEYFDIEIDPATIVNKLDTVTQRLIQVVRCLSAGAKVIVFDETTAGLSHGERNILFNHIKALAKKEIGIIFVSHIIGEMLEICDKITVLRGGELVCTDSMQGMTAAKIIELIVGCEMAVASFNKPKLTDEVLLSVKNLSSKNGNISQINFDLRKGEIIGVYGLRDQGQTLLLETLFGAVAIKESSIVELEGKQCEIKTPAKSLENGIEYLPNRGVKTLFSQKSIIENLIVMTTNYKDKGTLINEKKEKEFASKIADRYMIRGYSSLENNLSSLSGGNMQKVFFARCMALSPKVLMLMEPTEGIDIGAKTEMKQMILKAASEGMGVIIVTTEIEDIIQICHRVMIIRDRKLRCIMDANEEFKNAIVEESTS